MICSVYGSLLQFLALIPGFSKQLNDINCFYFIGYNSQYAVYILTINVPLFDRRIIVKQFFYPVMIGFRFDIGFEYKDVI